MALQAEICPLTKDDTADEISQVVRLLDFASSGGYSRSDWRSMQQEIRAIPDGEIERTAKEVLASGRRRDIPPVLDELCFVWSQKDPEAALAFAGSIPDKSLGKICYSVAFKGWAEDDWKSAKAWLDKLPANKLRDRLATELIERWRCMIRSLRFSFSPTNSRRANGRTPTKVLIDKDPELLLALYAKIPEGEEKDRLLISLKTVIQELRPDLASRLAPAN